MPSGSWKGTGPYLGAAASGRRAAQATGRVNADQPPRTAAFRAARRVAWIHDRVVPLTGRRHTAHRMAARYTSGTSQVYQRSTPGPYSQSVWRARAPDPACGLQRPAVRDDHRHYLGDAASIHLASVSQRQLRTVSAAPVHSADSCLLHVCSDVAVRAGSGRYQATADLAGCRTARQVLALSDTRRHFQTAVPADS